MRAALVALVLLVAAPVSAQDAALRGRADAGALDGGALDAGRVDGGRVDGGRVADAGAVAALPDEQPDLEEQELPEGHRPEVRLTIDPREGLATGDLVHVVVTVTLPEGDDVNVPRQAFTPFELHAQRHRDRPIDGGRREWTFEIDLLALEPGEHELPALRLRVITADGTVGTVRTEPQRITIGSLIANEPDAQPRPATRPVPVMQDDYTLAWALGILGAMLLTALLTWLVARWWSRRPKAAPPPPPPRPAWETALAKLDALRKKSDGMLERGEHVALVDGVSDALREYLGGRYDFNGLESTTDEVIARVRGARLPAGQVQEITALLGDCDLVKFAKAVPSEQQCGEMLAGAVRVVRATMPAASPAIAPPAPARPVPEVPVTRESPAMRGAPIQLPLAVDRVEAIEAVVGAAVMGTVSARVGDPSWDGTLVVQLARDLPDEYAARMALRSVHEKVARSIEGRRAGGVRLVIEHLHDGGRKSTYGPGIGEEIRAAATESAAVPDGVVPPPSAEPQPTLTGNAFADTEGAGPPDPEKGRGE